MAERRRRRRKPRRRRNRQQGSQQEQPQVQQQGYWKHKWKVWARFQGAMHCIGAVSADSEEEAWTKAQHLLDERELDAKRNRVKVKA
jgi:hypothetical protein